MPLRRLPPLSALRAFEAAARYSSFKEAAEELSVTPGAISQHIKQLEDDLGVPLFQRKSRAVNLTDAGRSLQPGLTAAFLQMREAIERVRVEEPDALIVNSSGAIISKWLLPRLHRFTSTHPELAVNIKTELSVNRFSGGDAPDVAIRYTSEPIEGLFHCKMHDEILLPLASPDLLKRLGPRGPEDLRHAPLLHDTSMANISSQLGWRAWFERAGLTAANDLGGVQFDPHAADQAIDAAISGAGFVLGRSLLAHDALSEGKLVCPFGPALTTGASYYIACRKGAEEQFCVRTFMDWATEEAASMLDVYEAYMFGRN